MGGFFTLVLMLCAVAFLISWIAKILVAAPYNVSESSNFRAVNATSPRLENANNNKTFPALTITFSSEEVLSEDEYFATISQYYDFVIETVD